MGHEIRKYSGGKRVRDIKSTGTSLQSSKDTVVMEDRCKGYIIGGPNLLPPTLDAIFLSPSWGRINYLNEGKTAFDISKCINISKIDSQQVNNSNKTGTHDDDNT